jgi:hypothetical protein
MLRLSTTGHPFAHGNVSLHIGRGRKGCSHNAHLNRAHELRKHLESFALVFHQRVTLTITAQPHATTQVIHRRQELLPFLINSREANHAFQHR